MRLIRVSDFCYLKFEVLKERQTFSTHAENTIGRTSEAIKSTGIFMRCIHRRIRTRLARNTKHS